MLSYREALALILVRLGPLPAGTVKLEEAAGRVLAQEIMAASDSPSFDNSAVDGYAVRVADTAGAAETAPVRLRLSGTVAAGAAAVPVLEPGAAIKIMTGARLPRGADAVIMKEFAGEQGRSVLLRRAVHDGENIRRRGAEFRKGQRVLSAGTRINVPAIGLVAAFGQAEVRVFGRPLVSIISTGSELVAPGAPRREGQIYDSNSVALAAACRELGVEVRYCARVADRRSELLKRLRRALHCSDVLLTAGGVSVGDKDLVRECCVELGVEEVFWRVAIKPGKPVYFGIRQTGTGKKTGGDSGGQLKAVFGLPGNPVAALLCFHQLVKPALLKMMGQASRKRPVLSALLVERLSKKAGRLEWVRGVLAAKGGALAVRPVTGQESHMLGGLAQAECLILFPASRVTLEKGSRVQVEILDWRG
ncbi:MAG: hypothetical protein A3F83_15605 [Candidatus Glassbacteria bacterium RIFCSPLOWO2_12_FULL_58_11]|uniref:Molybdopterin molybdenumtransferase n=1 Tax=Candidatus Glassbacteria bacterium RIFCSPLOWO2_12_FULL_58_11 TaxID=1817867 RepID=A0A1F5YLT7_9BACT|nr:MAG: hypothetical protein A3F83_15605 [Candidatus Glassbacteria bacterium RIFCSPLOWO2_12_FULL_58_11]